MSGMKTGAKPLSGVRIVVTRARDQASGFAKLLRGAGAKVLVCPTIKIIPPRSFAPLDQAIRNLEKYDWLVFTSVNGVEMFGRRFKKINPRFSGTARSKYAVFPSTLKTCAIGPATAERMRAYKIPVGKVSKEYVAESVLDALKTVKGQRILIPRAAVARDVLPVTLRKRGATVDVIEAYRTRPDASGLAQLKVWLKKPGVDCVTFTSSSTATNFFALVGGVAGGKGLLRKLIVNPRIRAASIGPVTTATLKAKGWPPRIVATKPTTQHLAAAIQRAFRSRQK